MQRLLAASATVVLAAALVACASVTPYQPQAKGYGYTEQKLEDNRYRVVFTGSPRTPRDTVQDYLLYRAAELTLERGQDYFVIVDNSAQEQATAGSSPSVGFGIGGFRVGGSGGVSVGVSTSTGTGGGRGAYRAQAEILLRSGAKPADDGNAFDARALKANLEPRIQRPAAH